jgi:hypothetical protein
MADVAPEDRVRDHRREQHLGIDAVAVLLLDPLLRRAGNGGVGNPKAEGLPGALGAAGAQVGQEGRAAAPCSLPGWSPLTALCLGSGFASTSTDLRRRINGKIW